MYRFVLCLQQGEFLISAIATFVCHQTNITTEASLWFSVPETLSVSMYIFYMQDGSVTNRVKTPIQVQFRALLL